MSSDATISVLRAVRLRPTKQRIALYEYLTTQRQPVSILEMSADMNKKMDTVTTYRTIDSFIKAGLARQVDLRQSTPLFELIDEHDHHHIVCTSCDRVEDFEGCNFSSLAKTALEQTSAFAAINTHSIELFGICKQCAH